MVQNQCFGPMATLVSPPMTPQAPSNLDLCFGAVMHSLKCLTQIADECTKEDQTEKEPKGFKKLEPFTQPVVLYISEPIDTDVDGDRTQPVDSYAHLLQLGNLAQAKIHFDHTLQVVHKCPINLPYLMVNTTLNGCLTWADQTNPNIWC